MSKKEKTKRVLFSILYWVSACTWGLPATLVGLLVTGFAILIGGKPHKNGCSYIVEIGEYWGGLELGPVALRGRLDDMPWYTDHINKHEFGHGVQFMYMGMFALFIVWIPSVIWYWYHRLGNPKHEYDWMWFEGNATRTGAKVANWLKGTPNDKK